MILFLNTLIYNTEHIARKRLDNADSEKPLSITATRITGGIGSYTGIRVRAPSANATNISLTCCAVLADVSKYGIPLTNGTENGTEKN